MRDQEWIELDGTIAQEFFDMVPVKIKTKMGETSGTLTVEAKHETEHWVKISASYNSSPFQNTVALTRFYLTQEQLNELQEKGPNCVLIAPSKNSN